jgi:Pectate lyase superfamily protein
MVLVTSWNGRSGDVLPVAGDYTSAMVNYVAGGAGGITRTLETKVRELVFSVKDYGAAGDGSTDDHDAIMRTITAMGPKGGILYFPPSVEAYMTGQHIVVPNNNNGASCICIQGAGTYTTYVTAKSGFSDTEIFLVNGTAQIRDLSISGQSQNTWGIRNRAAHTSVDSVQFVLFGALGGGFINDTFPGTYIIQRCIFGSLGTGIYNFDWGTGSTIRDNQILSSGDAIILSNAGRLPTSESSNEGINLFNNGIGSTGGNGIVINHGIDCRFDSNGITPIQSYNAGKRGVWINGDTGGLYFTRNWIEGLLCTVGCGGVLVDGNTFPNGNTLELAGPQPGSIFNWRIVNNAFIGDGGGYRVVLSNSTVMAVVANMFSGANGGLYTAGSGGQAGDHILAMANSFSGPCAINQPATLIFNSGGSGYSNSPTYPTSW